MSHDGADFDAIIVGSGPNGLMAAAILAVAGKRVLVIEAGPAIGGAVASGSITRPGFVHDIGSTIHTLGSASTAYADLGLGARGLEFVDFPILLSHTLDDGTGVNLHRSLGHTAEGLQADGTRYRRLMRPLVDNFEELAPMILGPLLRWPAHPFLLARFGVRAALPMALTKSLFKTAEARALLAGNAAHSFVPLHHPLTTAFALVLQAAGHVHGWPVARGGSGQIATALRGVIEDNGGIIETDRKVESRSELPGHLALFLDTTPAAAAEILGEALPARTQHRYRRFRHAPGVFKVDYALSGPIPWEFQDARSAGTIHVCGDYGEVAAAERATNRGEMPTRPFVLLTQACLADPSRAPAGAHTAWTYAHVPNGFEGDARPAIEAQIERFAPGFAKLILEAVVNSPRDLHRSNSNLVGGDVTGGSYSGLQTIRRPRLSFHPYRTGAPGAYLCSASTPPGAGAHGMSGYHAAHDALQRELK